MGLKRIEFEVTDWINLPENMSQWRALINRHVP
jgi:hypothetical protein